jgi:hypothetical protein
MTPQRPHLTKVQFIEPMYARLVNELPERKEWLYESSSTATVVLLAEILAESRFGRGEETYFSITAYEQARDSERAALALSRLGQCRCSAGGMRSRLHVECPSLQRAGPGAATQIEPNDEAGSENTCFYWRRLVNTSVILSFQQNAFIS